MSRRRSCGASSRSSSSSWRRSRASSTACGASSCWCPLLRDIVEPALGALLRLPAAVQRAADRARLSRRAGILLAIMILPTISSVTIEVLRTMPAALREGALALGATAGRRSAMAVLPYAGRGILGAVILGLARALGETMAVTMVIGNSPEISRARSSPPATRCRRSSPTSSPRPRAPCTPARWPAWRWCSSA